jgi:hypothetical protein
VGTNRKLGLKARSKYELSNVREGAQAEALFTIPEEYREIAAPKR